MKDISEQVKEYRDRKGWSQAILAEELYLDQTQISYIESGKRKVSSDILDVLVEQGIVKEGTQELRTDTKEDLDRLTHHDFRIVRDMINRLKGS